LAAWCGRDTPGNKLKETDVRYNSPPINLSADLSPYGGQPGYLQLVVKVGPTAGEDWLTWRDMVVTPK
jgi:hypothetical protein